MMFIVVALTGAAGGCTVVLEAARRGYLAALKLWLMARPVALVIAFGAAQHGQLDWMRTLRQAPWIGYAGPGLTAAILVLALGGCTIPSSVGARGGPHQFRSGQCKPGAPLAGVYLPSRLHVQKGCVTVTGIVDCLRREPDGDVHIELRLDRAYRRLLTSANASQRCPHQTGPHLVVEIIPQGEQLPFPDNSASLAGFVTPRAPQAGARIRVTGPYVLDTNALHDLIVPGKNVANWAEIHPAWNITVSSRAK